MGGEGWGPHKFKLTLARSRANHLPHDKQSAVQLPTINLKQSLRNKPAAISNYLERVCLLKHGDSVWVSSSQDLAYWSKIIDQVANYLFFMK